MTGGSAGIGFGICSHILQHNPKALYLLGKKEEHIAEARERLKQLGDISKVHSIQIELEDLHSVDNVAKELASKLDRLDALVCNAGLGVGVYNETKDGIDSHMQVNHIAQFHLAQILLPLLRKTPNSRLVLQSSDLHRGPNGDAKFVSVSELNQDIGPMKLYNRTKLAQVLFIRALKERKDKGQLGFDPDQDTGPWMNVTHPGGVRTDQQKQAEEAYGTLGKIGVAVVKPFMKDPVEEGCRPALFAITSEDIVKDRVQGSYASLTNKIRWFQSLLWLSIYLQIVPDRQVTEPSKEAQDTQLQENLWKLTEQILVEKLGQLPYKTQYI